MTDDERSAEARTLAERALGRLLAASAPTSERLIVLGGLVPPTLARTDVPEVPAHLGTTDVNILLVTHLTASHDLRPIEAALQAMRFTPHADGWRWSGPIENRIVKIEFLCDLDDQPAEAIVQPAGCSKLRAVNLRGTGHVERDHHEYIIHVPEGDMRVQIAGLSGYLLAKSAAVRTRGRRQGPLRFRLRPAPQPCRRSNRGSQRRQLQPTRGCPPGHEFHLPGDTRAISQRPRIWRTSLRPRSAEGHS